MLPEELLATGDLAGRGYGSLVSQIRETHGAVAGRIFRYVGDVARPVQLAHDAIAALAYGSTGALGRGLMKAAGYGAALAQPEEAESMERTLAGRVLKGALSGAWGDRLSEERNPFAVEMAVRRGGRDVPLTPVGLAAAFPRATPRLAVFLHGLCETEDAWRLAARAARSVAPRPPAYPERLRDELGFTPVLLRYNSGLHISENGRRLSVLIDELMAAWPVEVTSVVLIGHSMGGLVARSACHYGCDTGWCERVTDVFLLGTPHLGAPLEQAAHAAACALARLPETRPVARAINARSVGVKDLGRGYLTDECWAGQDPEAFLRSAARDIPFLAHANHYFISASLTREHDHRIGRHIGDLLVLHGSAWGMPRRGERLRFPVDNYRHYGGATHFDLLGHPAVGDQIVSWLSPRQLPASAAA
ncbi:MAG TPA: alpha/beta fold hydrolase [Solirubrobacteraceae bacterium]|nr:alpha/beta fold hydrolase [Solirubrobacteraceae bacterium]